MKTILLHDFTNEEVVAVMDLLKKNLPDYSEIAFAMSTPNSIKMKLNALLSHIEDEHIHFKNKSS